MQQVKCTARRACIPDANACDKFARTLRGQMDSSAERAERGNIWIRFRTHAHTESGKTISKYTDGGVCVCVCVFVLTTQMAAVLVRIVAVLHAVLLQLRMMGHVRGGQRQSDRSPFRRSSGPGAAQ